MRASGSASTASLLLHTSKQNTMWLWIFVLYSWFQAKNSGTVSWRGVNCRPIDRALARAGVGIAITLDD